MIEALSSSSLGKFTVAGSARTYLTLLNAIVSECHIDTHEITNRISTEASANIPEELGDDAQRFPTDGRFPVLVESMAIHYKGLNWQPFLDATRKMFMNTSNSLKQREFTVLLSAVLRLTNEIPGAAEMLTDLAQRGILHHLIGAESAGGSAVAAPVLALLLFYEGDTPLDWPPDAKAGEILYSRWLRSENRDVALTHGVALLAIACSQDERLRQLARDGAGTRDSAVAAVLGKL
jgi:hypothetical protein